MVTRDGYLFAPVPSRPPRELLSHYYPCKALGFGPFVDLVISSHIQLLVVFGVSIITDVCALPLFTRIHHVR